MRFLGVVKGDRAGVPRPSGPGQAPLRHDMVGGRETRRHPAARLRRGAVLGVRAEVSLQLRSTLLASPGMRSADAQGQVFGTTAHDLQLALARHWKLPELLVTLMGDNESDNPRVRTVRLALSLARHAQQGWDDPALPDDYAELEQLLRLSRENVLLRVGAPMPTSPPPSSPPAPEAA